MHIFHVLLPDLLQCADGAGCGPNQQIFMLEDWANVSPQFLAMSTDIFCRQIKVLNGSLIFGGGSQLSIINV